MPDPLDTLRTAIAQAIFKRKCYEAVKDGLGYLSTIPREFCEYADDALAMLADAAKDPERQRAILGLIGLEVVGEARSDGIDVAANGSGDTLAYFVAVLPFGTPVPQEDPVLVCRVRPQGAPDHA